MLRKSSIPGLRRQIDRIDDQLLRLLNRVSRIFSVMHDALSDSEKLAIVFLYELLESGNIAVLASVDKIQVIACHCHHFALC